MIAPATRAQCPARSNGDSAAQAGCAAAAAATAAPTSARPPAATEAKASPDDGLTAGTVPPSPGRQPPPMYS